MNFPYTIRYFADLNPGSGYNNAARGYLRALQTLGIGSDRVHLIPAVTSAQHAGDVDENDWITRTYLLNRDFPGEKHVNIVHLHPPLAMRHWALGYYNVALCAWELDRLPAQKLVDADNKQRPVVDGLNDFDEIWVPAPLTKKAFVNSGVKKPIHIIPHALLPELLEVEPRNQPPTIPDVHPVVSGSKDPNEEPVRFYFIGSWDVRKNVEALLQAYFETGWNPSTPVELLLHCVPSSRDYDVVQAHGWIAQEAVKAIKATAPSQIDLPNFHLRVLPRSYSWVTKVHRQGHVFITATRGEGFCLPALEAAAMGNLVVGTDAPLSHFAGSGLIDYHIPAQQRRIQPMPHMAGYELGLKWHDPDPDKITEAFLWAYDAVRGGHHSGASRARRVRSAYSPEAIGKHLQQRLEAIKDVLDESGW